MSKRGYSHVKSLLNRSDVHFVCHAAEMLPRCGWSNSESSCEMMITTTMSMSTTFQRAWRPTKKWRPSKMMRKSTSMAKRPEKMRSTYSRSVSYKHRIILYYGIYIG